MKKLFFLEEEEDKKKRREENKRAYDRSHHINLFVRVADIEIHIVARDNVAHLSCAD